MITGTKSASGYAQVHTAEPTTKENKEVPPVHIAGKAQSAEEVRALPIPEVTLQLENLLLQVAAQGPSPLTGPLDKALPVSAMGLDSMTLVQFKGVLEKR